MSRSYKKYGFGSYYFKESNKFDKVRYHRDSRHHVNVLLKQQQRYGTDIFVPYEDICSVCWQRDNHYWCDDPNEYVINYNEFDNAYSKPYIIRCMGCRYSANPNNNYEYYYWMEEPIDELAKNKFDRSIASSDNWYWKSAKAYFLSDISDARKTFDKEVFGNARKNIWEDYLFQVEFGPYNSNWFLMSFLMSNDLIPKSFTSSDELISWLRQNQEQIIKSWYKLRYLRK